MSNKEITVSDDMLSAAMKVAVKEGVFPKNTDMPTYLLTYQKLTKILQSAIDAENIEIQRNKE